MQVAPQESVGIEWQVTRPVTSEGEGWNFFNKIFDFLHSKGIYDGGTNHQKKASSTTYIYELEDGILHFSVYTQGFIILMTSAPQTR